MRHHRKFSTVWAALLLIESLSLVLLSPTSYAAPNPAETECYSQALSFGATRSAHQRATYLCTGATSAAPAQCYWKALSFGADDRAKQLAARLCRGATSAAPAQCYWDTLGPSRSRQSQAVNNCMAKPPVTIPIEIQDCVAITRRQLQVSPSAALNACSQEFYRQ
jgi:hypothetical protein